MSLVIEDFGGRVARVWSELRPTTRGLVERALQASNSTSPQARNVPYDPRADLELSRLLAALDDRVSDPASLDTEKSTQLRRVADTCAAVLQEKTQSAEVFVQLVRRAEQQRDYPRIDVLADALSSRFAPSEICELARSEVTVVRALAYEALSQFPTSVLVGLLSDPVDSEIARDALRRQAVEFGSEEARQIMNALDQVDEL
ncbi:MAG: hypothetical protein ACRD8U_05260 [Pyrinomonadaceae bacterium]